MPNENSSFLYEWLYFIVCWVVFIVSAIHCLIDDKQQRKWFLLDIKGR